ncbi:Negative regulator of mitotic exit [Pleurotus pulmonarius]|nr:Negative regulator of mitotic exit [Pleurotus pulmonarius]KAF4580642.1 Negative regulator of mitotic exit [Pleurotus pulmonarius]
MSFIINLFSNFFGKDSTPNSIGVPHQETLAAYPWSLHPLHLLPPTVRPNNSFGQVAPPAPPPPPESPSTPPFPRHGHSVSASPTSHGDLYLFGGLVDGHPRNDVYLFRTSSNDSNDGKNHTNESEPRPISAALFETGGAIPSPRVGHAGAIISSVLIVWGGKTATEQTPESESQSTLPTPPNQETSDDGLYLLNLVQHQWTRLAVRGPAPSARHGHAAAMIGSLFFVVGGQDDRTFFNDIWAFDLNTLRSQPVWELYEPTTGDRPAPRSGHSCVAHGDNIILFGGTDGIYHYHDTWAFDTKTRTWAELQCIGYIPENREGHAASLVGDVMYVFGGRGVGRESGEYLRDVVALNITSQRWFMFKNMGPGPSARWGNAMASVGSKVVALGGELPTPGSEKLNTGVGANDTNAVHILDTARITYPPHHKAPPPHDNGNGEAF